MSWFIVKSFSFSLVAVDIRPYSLKKIPGIALITKTKIYKRVKSIAECYGITLWIMSPDDMK